MNAYYQKVENFNTALQGESIGLLEGGLFGECCICLMGLVT